jgi:hypothetical protein
MHVKPKDYTRNLKNKLKKKLTKDDQRGQGKGIKTRRMKSR